jgi:DNA-binding NtrC family response regulator
MPERTVLLVDDEAVIRHSIGRVFAAEGYRVIEAESIAQAQELFRQATPDAAILDYMLPDGDGMELMRSLRATDSSTPIIVLTGHGSIDLAVAAMRDGADDFVTKPVDLPALLLIVQRSIENRRNRQQTLAQQSRRSRTAVDPFGGESAVIRSLAERARGVVDSSVPVLIQGETGVGKGLLASWLHANGPRAAEAFVDLNCAGLSRELLETELFGHEKGAFTGALSAKMGLFEIAHHGTIFLDEIGDVSQEIQPKLLKVVEAQRFRRVGDVKDRQVDVRLIAATHHDLAERSRAGDFRRDLYYRISVVPLLVPPLRERAQDVLILARFLLARCCCELDRPEIRLAPSAEQALLAYSWPGNVRELRNVLERAVLLRRQPVLEAADLELGESRAANASTASSGLSLRDAERRHIVRVLQMSNGDVPRAAQTLGLSRSALYQKLRKHRLGASGALGGWRGPDESGDPETDESG